jgi:hypothetical protein
MINEEQKVDTKQICGLKNDPARQKYIQAELVLMLKLKQKFLLTPLAFNFSNPITFISDYILNYYLCHFIHS